MRTVLLISPNVTDKMGGEAIKVLQFARFLKARGRPFKIICHERSAHKVEEEFTPDEYHMIRNDGLQIFMSKTPGLK